MKMRMKFLRTAAWMLLTALIIPIVGCTPKDSYTPVSGLDKSRDLTLKIAIPYETNKALNTVSNAFMERYPNVNIQLQYIEDYDANAVQLFKDGEIDIIFQKDVSYTEYANKDEKSGESVPTGKTTEDYFYDFAADSEIDFSNTTSDITDNYRHSRKNEDGTETTYQYCYPLGGEMRGVYINVTMLRSLGLEVPRNYDEFMHCCAVVKDAGYIPVQSTVVAMVYGLGISQAANTVVHDPEALAKMAAAEAGVSACFADTFRKIYDMMVNRYIDYKAIEETGAFMDGSDAGQARSFLGLRYDKNTMETIKPENNSGYVAFFPYISSTATEIDNLIDEYELDTEYQFICTPLNDAGANSPAYITPYYGICANKNSENLIWIREFVNFLFQDENIKTYSENASIIPNSKDALQYVANNFGMDVATDITLCGQIKFSVEYNGFRPLGDGLVTLAKGNAQKYMLALNRDENGNISYETDENGHEFLYLGNGETAVGREFVGDEDPAMPGYAFCTLAYYMDALESQFVKYRAE